MENQSVSAYCLLKIENINDFFSNSAGVWGPCKKDDFKLFQYVTKRRRLCQVFFLSLATAQSPQLLQVITKLIQM